MGKFYASEKLLSASDNLITHPVRAKFYPTPDGGMRLACVQAFSEPRFREEGWETREKKNGRSIHAFDPDEEILDHDPLLCDIKRATRRARINAFDLIMCNPELDAFVTFTYSPESVEDKADYDECYKHLGVWLANRVQRSGLKYVCVPERTKKGDIHFHAIMNGESLKLAAACSPHTGRQLKHKGNPLFNVSDWKHGFSSAEFIRNRDDSEDSRVAVSKYIFKYMGKQAGQKIGGRYCLIGGDLARPTYAYGDKPEEFFGDQKPIYKRENIKINDGLDFSEYNFI